MSTESWLEGPLEDVPPLLMPVAHSVIQARRELHGAAAELDTGELWLSPGGAASVGFHLRHIAGTIDRLLTYARGDQLDDGQLAAIRREKEPGNPPAGVPGLLGTVDEAVDRVLRTVRSTEEDELLRTREVGRKRLPSNVLGLLFHIAEHTQRHTGQVVTTAKIIQGAGLAP